MTLLKVNRVNLAHSLSLERDPFFPGENKCGGGHKKCGIMSAGEANGDGEYEAR